MRRLIEAQYSDSKRQSVLHFSVSHSRRFPHARRISQPLKGSRLRARDGVERLQNSRTTVGHHQREPFRPTSTPYVYTICRTRPVRSVDGNEKRIRLGHQLMQTTTKVASSIDKVPYTQIGLHSSWRKSSRPK